MGGTDSLIYTEDRPAPLTPTSHTQQYDQNEGPHANATMDMRPGAISVVSRIPPLPAALVQYMESPAYMDSQRVHQYTQDSDNRSE